MNTLITPENFTKINRDLNGNPRYVCHFYNLLNEADTKEALKKAKQLGGRKYNNKNFGGGIVFQSYNIENLCTKINELNKKC